jgi:hypothetical protein
MLSACSVLADQGKEAFLYVRHGMFQELMSWLHALTNQLAACRSGSGVHPVKVLVWLPCTAIWPILGKGDWSHLIGTGLLGTREDSVSNSCIRNETKVCKKNCCMEQIPFSEVSLQAGRVVDRPPATKLATKLLSGLCESPQTAKLSPRTASGTGG